MNKFILHCHVTGEFWESYESDAIEIIVENKLKKGADIDDFSVYKARPLMLMSTNKQVTGVNIFENFPAIKAVVDQSIL